MKTKQSNKWRSSLLAIAVSAAMVAIIVLAVWVSLSGCAFLQTNPTIEYYDFKVAFNGELKIIKIPNEIPLNLNDFLCRNLHITHEICVLRWEISSTEFCDLVNFCKRFGVIALVYGKDGKYKFWLYDAKDIPIPIDEATFTEKLTTIAKEEALKGSGSINYFQPNSEGLSGI